MWRRRNNPYKNSAGGHRRRVFVNSNRHGHVSEVDQDLNTEIADRLILEGENSRLSKELEETKAQWQRQKDLKEMFINREKETRRELERLQKYSDPETLSTARIATQVNNNIKRRKKRDLQTDYEELKVAYIVHQKQLNNELQVEKERNIALQNEVKKSNFTLSANPDVATVIAEVNALKQLLQKEQEQNNGLLKSCQELKEAHKSTQENLEKACLVNQKYENEIISFRQQVDHAHTLQQELEALRYSHHQISQKYDSDVVSLRQQVKTLQGEIDMETSAHAATVKNGWRAVNALKAELEELKTQLNIEVSRNQCLSKKLEDEWYNYEPPRKKARRAEEPEVQRWQQQQILPNTPTLQPQKGAELHASSITPMEIVVTPPAIRNSPSFWKTK